MVINNNYRGPNTHPVRSFVRSATVRCTSIVVVVVVFVDGVNVVETATAVVVVVVVFAAAALLSRLASPTSDEWYTYIYMNAGQHDLLISVYVLSARCRCCRRRCRLRRRRRRHHHRRFHNACFMRTRPPAALSVCVRMRDRSDTHTHTYASAVASSYR